MLKRMSRYGLIFFCLMATFAQTIVNAEATKQPTNLATNGDFEKGIANWGYQQWKGKLLPGYLDRENPYQGLASFRMTDPKGTGMRFMTLPITELDLSQNYQLSLALASKDVPAKAVVVRLLQFGMDKPNKKGEPTPQGWIQQVPGNGVADLIVTGGNHDWKEFSFNISNKSFKSTTKYLTLFIYHAKIQSGVVGIDQVRFIPMKTMPTSSTAPSKSNAQRTPAKIDKNSFRVETYQTHNPTVLIIDTHAKASIELTPNQSLYRVDKLPDIQIHYQTMHGGKLTWKMIDGFGKVLVQGDKKIDAAGSMAVAWPTSKDSTSGDGYYELIATVTQGNKLPGAGGEVRRSFGVLSPPAPLTTEEPFGLWVQGNRLYPELGVRWTRSSLYYRLWKKQPKVYMQKMVQGLKDWHEKGIRVLVYPKDQPTKYALSHKLIKDTPEAWQALEAYWTDLVKALKGHVDAWGVINEPYRGMWKGDDALIVRYWALMRKIIDHYDPDTPLIGPCLNTNTPHMMAQYQNLMKLGFAPLVDGVELHPYTGMNMPAQVDWRGKIEQTRKLTRQADKAKPIWATEMGISCNYDQELYQAQYTARCFLWAKRMNIKMLNWHMFSWPQGPNLNQRNFGFFRNNAAYNPDKTWGSKVPQPRPAAIAYGVMTRQLAGATFKHELDYLGPSIKAFVFQHADGPRLVIWSTNPREYKIRLPMQNTVMMTNLFGQTRTATPSHGMLSLKASPSPVYLSAIDDSYLQTQPLAQVVQSIKALVGSETQAHLKLHNPTSKSAQISVQWLKNPNLRIVSKKTSWNIGAKGDLEVMLKVFVDAKARAGHEVAYGRVQLNGRYVSPLSIPVEIQPVVQIINVQPTMVWQQVPALTVTLQKNGEVNEPASLQVAGSDHPSIPVAFGGKTTQTITLPLAQLKPDQLQLIQLNTVRSGRVEQSEQRQYSFVPATRIISTLQIDGDLSDWPISQTLWQQHSQFSVRWGWDSENLYLAVRATDAVHYQTQLLDRMWMADSIQIGLAADQSRQWLRKPVSEMMESDFMELCLSLNQQGQARLHRGRTPNRSIAPVGEVSQKKVSFAVCHQGNQTTYEMRLPLAQVGLKPVQMGDLVRVSVLLNKNDGHGRSFAEWFSGIGNGKNPDLFGHLILRGPSRRP